MGAAIDLFAGPGGWDVGAAALGIHPLGIEYEESAVATREAVGHRTLQADVAELDPDDFAPCDLLIASPPCQAWSMAGNRGGEADKDLVYVVTDELAAGDDHGDHAAEWEDQRSRLVTEPLRWALALRPRYIAFEQVPPVLDYWKYVAAILRDEGYGTWVGILECERYGIPQTRERAILMAELDRTPMPPTPTHQRYIPGQPARGELTLEGEILPWVSMADALGWTSAGAVTSTGNTKGGEQQISREADAPSRTVDSRPDQWQVGFPRADDRGDGEYRERDFRDGDEPAFTVTEKARSAVRMVSGNQENATVRESDEPAPTVTAQPGRHGTHFVVARRTAGGYDVLGNDRPAPTIKGISPHEGAPRFDDLVRLPAELVDGRDFVPSDEVGSVPPALNTGRDWKEGGDRSDAQTIPGTEPAPTLDGQAGKMKWVDPSRPNSAVRTEDEPAPTVHFSHQNDRRWTLETHANTRPNEGEHRQRPEGLTREGEEPAPTVDSRSGGWKRALKVPETGWEGAGNVPRPEDAPASTIRTRTDLAEWVDAVDVPAPTVTGGGTEGGGGVEVFGRGGRDRIQAKLSDEGWEERRPATTIAGDARVFPPGGHTADDGRDNERMVGRPENAVRVSIEEAAVLQGFSPNYPWQGSRSKKFQQIGNAVPPPLAEVVLRSLIERK